MNVQPRGPDQQEDAQIAMETCPVDCIHWVSKLGIQTLCVVYGSRGWQPGVHSRTWRDSTAPHPLSRALPPAAGSPHACALHPPLPNRRFLRPFTMPPRFSPAGPPPSCAPRFQRPSCPFWRSLFPRWTASVSGAAMVQKTAGHCNADCVLWLWLEAVPGRGPLTLHIITHPAPQTRS